jgi:DNA-directed RNA polymerase subunit alpha
MIEDIALFMINLKNIRFKIKNDQEQIEVKYNFANAKDIKGQIYQMMI